MFFRPPVLSLRLRRRRGRRSPPRVPRAAARPTKKPTRPTDRPPAPPATPGRRHPVCVPCSGGGGGGYILFDVYVCRIHFTFARGGGGGGRRKTRARGVRKTTADDGGDREKRHDGPCGADRSKNLPPPDRSCTRGVPSSSASFTMDGRLKIHDIN